MTSVFSNALKERLEVGRIIGRLGGHTQGPTVVFIAGMHGNEPSGIFALHQVFTELEKRQATIKGVVYGLSGHLEALSKGVRYCSRDLNRLWTENWMKDLEAGDTDTLGPDGNQQRELYRTLMDILAREEGPFYFVDLHTTSSETRPFTLMNDSLLNRTFVRQYPVPTILGIEEYLSGALLDYLNTLGYVAFGYESGQHDSVSAIQNHKAFVRLTLYFTGSLDALDADYDLFHQQLKATTAGMEGFFEITSAYSLDTGQRFRMNPGYTNFQQVTKGELMGQTAEGVIETAAKGLVFMPLYQAYGDHGFFLIRKIPLFFMWLSAALRHIRAYRILPLLPGVRRMEDGKDTLMVNKKVARYMAKQFFHLFGYRNRRLFGSHFMVSNREALSRWNDYAQAPWRRRKPS